MPHIKLQSSDGDIFEVDLEVAKCSGTIKTMLEYLGIDDEEEIVPLPNVNSNTLKRIIDWATFHVNYSAVSKDDKEMRRHNISSWDKNFLEVDQTTLFELILAADYLDIEGLMTVACKTIANQIIGKTPEEIRETFNLKNDLSPAEEKNSTKENELCM